jgi:hypothetical protein
MADQEMMLVRKIHVLQRYWIWADAMKIHFLRELDRVDDTAPKGEPSIQQLMYMSYWYATLYVVIEGWRELKLNDPTVDPLLQSPHVDLLRLYRNGVFHFQEKYWSDKIVGFVMGGADSARWIRELHQAIGEFLLARIREANARRT